MGYTFLDLACDVRRPKSVYCEALATEEWFAHSDHAPIVADFRL